MRLKVSLFLVLLMGMLTIGTPALSQASLQSPPELLQRLDVMFAWVERTMGITGGKRPPVFIFTRSMFMTQCEKYKDHGCNRTLGLYVFKTSFIYALKQSTTAQTEGTIIHEMAHYLQHLKYGQEYMNAWENDANMQGDAIFIANLWLVREHKYTWEKNN